MPLSCKGTYRRVALVHLTQDYTSGGKLLNAVTAQTHAAKSYDRAYDLEAAGGQLLELPKADWREILEAV
jgi:hypothetical protein